MNTYHKLIALIFIFCAPALLSQEKEIKNKKTSKYLNIPKTNIFLIPPADFTVATNFAGIQKNEDNQIMIMTGMNYSSDAANMSRSRFEKEGAKVFEETTYKINGFQAKFISVKDDSLHKTNLLAFGDSTVSLLFFARFSDKDPKLEKQIRTSLLSVIYTKK